MPVIEGEGLNHGNVRRAASPLPDLRSPAGMGATAEREGQGTLGSALWEGQETLGSAPAQRPPKRAP